METSSLILSLLLLATAIYWYLTRTYNYWKSKNVPLYRGSVLPGFGHAWPILAFKENVTSFFGRMYSMSESSMTAFYFLRKPALLVRDPDLVKSVLQADFSSFRKNGIALDEATDPLLSKNPFFASDYRTWKNGRIHIAGHLSNKKMQCMFVIVQDVCSRLSGFVLRNQGSGGESAGLYECELKRFFSRYTGEVVANLAFGINGQSFDDDPDKLAFTNVVNELFDVSFINGIGQTLLFYVPEITGLFGMGFLGKSTERYFRETLEASIRKRREEKLVANDFLQFCMESNREGDLDGIIADIVVFYVDVYETTSAVMSILFYHLSQNADIQEKLRAHVNTALEDTGGLVTYDSLKNMDYLECVIYESIRMLPSLGVLIKACTKETALRGSDGLECSLRPGDLVFISAMGLHNDKKHWTDPEIFDPERFSKESRADRHKYTFLGFSEGPRICAGIKMAMMLIKLASATLITQYSIEHSEITKTPIELVPWSFVTYVKGGLWAKFRKLNERTNSTDI